jgi:hypothetical protein
MYIPRLHVGDAKDVEEFLFVLAVKNADNAKLALKLEELLLVRGAQLEVGQERLQRIEEVDQSAITTPTLHR